MAVFLYQITTHAQSGKLGSWNAVNFTYKPDKRLSLFTELEARSQLFIHDFYYREVKAGAGYSFSKKLSLLFAVSDCRTYSSTGNFKNLQTKEFRTWEQLIWNNYLSSLRIEQRWRVEQRWVNSAYRNRFRYRLNPVFPINKKVVMPHVFYATVYDEIFVSDKTPYFEGHRFFTGGGYLFSKAVAFQAGFLRQYSYRAKNDSKNFIQTTLQFSMDKSNVAHTDKHPVMMN